LKRILAALFFCISTVHASTRIVDLSNGAAFPSNNSALFENPAALATYGQTSVELGVFTDGHQVPETGTASLVSRVGQLGFGVGTWKASPARDSLSLGFGYRVTEKLALGLGATIPFQSGAAQIDVGFHFPLGEALTAGLVFYDVTPSPARWTLALASPFAGGRVIPEIDFTFTNRYGSIEPASVDSVAGFSILLQWLTVRVGYPFRVYPEYVFARAFEVGLLVRFSQRVTAFAVANSHLGPRYFFGFKFN
jgi:hypothetical protein